jgi:hypothetical protein
MNPPDFTVTDIVIDAPEEIQIRDQNGQISIVNRQTAYNTILANPFIQKLSYDRSPDNVRINLIPVLGSNLNQYEEDGLNLASYNIVPNDYYVIVLNISTNPATIIGLYHLPPAAISSAPPALPSSTVSAAPPDAEISNTAEYRAALADRMTCPICMVHEKNTRLNPCGHLLCAHDTATIMASNSKICPICRTPIQSTAGIFYGGSIYKYKLQKYKNKLI